MTGPDAGAESTVADCALKIVTALAAEVAVLRERLELVERVAAMRGLLGPDDVDAFSPDPTLAELLKAKRKAFIHRVFGPMRASIERTP